MESPTERMPIACVHCAKAKSKCMSQSSQLSTRLFDGQKGSPSTADLPNIGDKKVPCSRCVSKQIVCLSRATRRSSQNPARRGTLPRTQSERSLHQPTEFRYPLPQNNMPTSFTAESINVQPQYQHRYSLSDTSHPYAAFGPELDPAMVRNDFSQTPSDMSTSMTPMMMTQMNQFMPFGGTSYDAEADNRFLNLGISQAGVLDMSDNILADFMNSPTVLHDTNNMMLMNSSNNLPPSSSGMSSDISGYSSRTIFESVQKLANRLRGANTPSSPCSVGSLQEPDAVLALHPLWPYFLCQRSEKLTSSQPKTARIYLEGLSQTLRNQSTWQAWTSQIDERQLDISFERKISTEPIVGWSREKLLAITQGFLHKALDIHRGSQVSKDDSPASPESANETFLMLPPPEVMQYFLRSYIVRYEPYYCSIPGGKLDPNSLMHSSNSKAASLLILLMVASGASATSTPEARYVTSGLTEACRLSLFDTVEKDVAQAREVLILRAALLLVSLAAWSGDKWHMDMAMGQRGLYLAMLAHAGILDASESHIDVNECRLDPEIAWGDWKEHEGRHRLAHSWIVVDQEISLFSDTTPQLSIVDLHVPVPDTDDLWYASSCTDWLSLFENTYGTTYQSPASVRDSFTKFVDGELAGKKLSPTQLRLLLHPLQSQVSQLRHFIACLPDGGAHSRGSRAVSKAATKLRLEEISTLLQQWYAISKNSFAGHEGTCWTTCANLIMYHLISLNTITSFKCIEQFARREIAIGQARYAQWLQNKCIDQAEEALFHCGQVLRLIRSMPKAVRPPWWAGAIYRVAMVGWATSLSRGGLPFDGAMSSSQFAIDNVTPESDPVNRFVKHQEGEPTLTAADGTALVVCIPSNVLRVCAEVLEDDSSMRLADGIRRKLRLFAEMWKD